MWQAGDADDWVFVLCQGLAMSSYLDPSGEQRVVQLHTRGSVLGLLEPFDGRPRAFDVDILVSGWGMKVPRATVRSALESGGAGAMGVVKLMVHLLHSSNRRVAELGYGSVEQRVARILVRLVENYALEDARGLLVPVALSKTHLAQLVGCRLETLVRTLKQPEVLAAVSFQREGFVVLDAPGLRRLAAA